MSLARSVLRALRLIAFVLLTLGVAGGPGLTAACSDATGSGCCKVCKTGKACGDTCIAKTDTCHQPSGCACNG